MNKDNIIPPMTHPYGMCWQQPPTYLILIDDTHAVMSRLDLKYSWIILVLDRQLSIMVKCGKHNMRMKVR